MNNRENRGRSQTETTWWHWERICIFASDGDVLPWQRLNLGKPAFCCFIFVDLDCNPVPAIAIPMTQTTDIWLSQTQRVWEWWEPHCVLWGRSGLLSWMICIREPTSPWSWNAGISKRWNWQIMCYHNCEFFQSCWISPTHRGRDAGSRSL